MKPISTIIVAPLLGAMLCSCEGTTSQDWKVKNASNDTIRVSPSFHVVDMQAPTTVILPGEQVLVASSDDGRGANSNSEAHLGRIDRIVIATASDTSSKNGTLSTDWVSRSEHKKRMPSHWYHEHVMTVTDVDLE